VDTEMMRGVFIFLITGVISVSVAVIGCLTVIVRQLLIQLVLTRIEKMEQNLGMRVDAVERRIDSLDSEIRMLNEDREEMQLEIVELRKEHQLCPSSGAHRIIGG